MLLPTEDFTSSSATLRSGLFVLDGGYKCFGNVSSIHADKSIVFQVNGAVRTLSQSLAQNLLRPWRPSGNHHHLATVLLLLPQRLFQSVRVRLIHFIRDIF